MLFIFHQFLIGASILLPVYVVLPVCMLIVVFVFSLLSFICVLLSENVGMVARSRGEISGSWTSWCRL